MTEAPPSKEDPQAANAAAGEAPKKKVKKGPPPCPPSISTAYVVLRAVASSLLASEADDAPPIVGPFQPTYLKDKELTGKFSVTLNTKRTLVESAFWEQLQAQLSTPFLLSAMSTTAEALQAHGSTPHVWDEAAEKKKAKLGDLTLCCINDSLLCLPPSVPYATTEGLRMEILAEESPIKLLKKAVQVQLKFRVLESTEQPLAAVTEASSVTDWSWKPLTLSTTSSVWEQPAVAEEEAPASTAPVAAGGEMVVTAWEVSGKIDYTKLVEKFGSTLITDDLMERLARRSKTSKLHRFLRRGMFFSHRDLDTLLTKVEQGVPMYLYTGRGPSSSSMHLGHLIPFLFTQWLQEALDVPLVIQMTDDEKFLFKGNYDPDEGDNLSHYQSLTMENAKDIIACGFDYNKTFLFSDLDYVGTMYPNIVRIWKAVTTNTVNGIFGFDGSSNIGKIAFPAVQAAPSFASSFPTVLQADRNTDRLCLIPCAIDQDPYFRMTRDIAPKLVNKKHALLGKPSLIHSKFFPPLQGAEGKMSASDTNSAIFLTDTPEEIERKIKEHAFSGGRETKKEQEKYGADLDLDVSYQWLRFFLEDDDELARIGESYGSGSGDFWSTALVKNRLIEVLQELVAAHQERRAKITDDEVRKWMQERSIV